MCEEKPQSCWSGEAQRAGGIRDRGTGEAGGRVGHSPERERKKPGSGQRQQQQQQQLGIGDWAWLASGQPSPIPTEHQAGRITKPYSTHSYCCHHHSAVCLSFVSFPLHPIPPPFSSRRPVRPSSPAHPSARPWALPLDCRLLHRQPPAGRTPSGTSCLSPSGISGCNLYTSLRGRPPPSSLELRRPSSDCVGDTCLRAALGTRAWSAHHVGGCCVIGFAPEWATPTAASSSHFRPSCLDAVIPRVAPRSRSSLSLESVAAMDQTWGPYADTAAASNRQARYAPHSLTSPQQPTRDPNGSATLKADPYSTSISSRAASMAISSPGGADSRNMQYNGDRDGDVPMEDADQYKPKFPSRPTHQSRNSAQFVQQQEESAAARRYSPMNLSPSSPYTQTPQQPIPGNFGAFTPQQQPPQQPPQPSSNRQSPTRSTNPYISPPQSYHSPTCTCLGDRA
jgi:hypothetical protein